MGHPPTRLELRQPDGLEHASEVLQLLPRVRPGRGPRVPGIPTNEHTLNPPRPTTDLTRTRTRTLTLTSNLTLTLTLPGHAVPLAQPLV